MAVSSVETVVSPPVWPCHVGVNSTEAKIFANSVGTIKISVPFGLNPVIQDPLNFVVMTFTPVEPPLPVTTSELLAPVSGVKVAARVPRRITMTTDAGRTTIRSKWPCPIRLDVHGTQVSPNLVRRGEIAFTLRYHPTVKHVFNLRVIARPAFVTRGAMSRSAAAVSPSPSKPLSRPGPSAPTTIAVSAIKLTPVRAMMAASAAVPTLQGPGCVRVDTVSAELLAQGIRGSPIPVAFGLHPLVQFVLDSWVMPLPSVVTTSTCMGRLIAAAVAPTRAAHGTWGKTARPVQRAGNVRLYPLGT